MGKTNKLVMQVTVDALEFPGLFEDLAVMRDGRRRANKLLRMAFFGWLIERGRVGATVPAAPPAPAPPSKAPRSKVGCTIAEFVDFADRDDD